MMKFEDVALVGFLLVLYFIAARDIEAMRGDNGAYQQASLVYHSRTSDRAALLRTGSRP
jgi:hypothetical protein